MNENVLLITILLFGSFLALMLTGIPLAFVLGTVSMVLGMIYWGPDSISILYYSATQLLSWFTLSALPLFVFMGLIFQKSGIADELFHSISVLAGRIRGGLLIGSIFICTILAAMVGESGAATVTMGLIAVPAMLKRGYNKNIVLGTTMSAAGLGFLIPPSIAMIVYSLIARTSLGKMFVAGILPGIMLALLYVLYILIRCGLNPELTPFSADSDFDDSHLNESRLSALKGLILPGLIVFIVLGFILLGITSPTEAAAVGMFGSLGCAAIKKKLNFQIIKEACLGNIQVTAMMGYIFIAAIAFSKIYDGLGASFLIKDILQNSQFSPYIVLVIMMLIWFVLGALMDEIAILLITLPIFLPIVKSFGFDPTWFGILFVVNSQTALITPPYGFSLFFMKSVVPENISMTDIYRSVLPFIAIQLVALAIIIIFPQIVLWLPNVLFLQN